MGGVLALVVRALVVESVSYASPEDRNISQDCMDLSVKVGVLFLLFEVKLFFSSGIPTKITCGCVLLCYNSTCSLVGFLAPLMNK